MKVKISTHDESDNKEYEQMLDEMIEVFKKHEYLIGKTRKLVLTISQRRRFSTFYKKARASLDDDFPNECCTTLAEKEFDLERTYV